MIREVIVVEGKSDVSAVRRAVDAEIVCTNGFSLDPRAITRIRAAQRRCGVIILTDPDTAGEQIRRRLVSLIGDRCKHARLQQADCTRPDGNIGVENASPDAIRDALERARPEKIPPRRQFKNVDLVRHGLTGTKNASHRRARLGELLGIGDNNARQLLRRLNHYDISRDEFDAAVAALDRERLER
ncbi:MAG: ribonuclease M5 [Myxococcota bacterium]